MIKAAVNVLAAEIDPDDEVCENGVPDATSDLRGSRSSGEVAALRTVLSERVLATRTCIRHI